MLEITGKKYKKCCKLRGIQNVGYDIGKDIVLATEQKPGTTTIMEGRGKELLYGHVRTGHMRWQWYNDERGRRRRKLIFIHPLIVRPDLPMKPRLTPRSIRRPKKKPRERNPRRPAAIPRSRRTEFFHWLIKLIKTLGMSSSQVAKEIGVTYGAVNDWVSGHSTPGRKRILQLNELARGVEYPEWQEINPRKAQNVEPRALRRWNPSKRERLAHLRKQKAEFKKSAEISRARRAKENELVYERLRIHQERQKAIEGLQYAPFSKKPYQPMTKVYAREYSSYRSMISRCYDSKNPSYKYYGGKGIKVWKKWLGPEGFSEFFHVMGERPAGTSLERVNIKKNYYPNNCIWGDTYLQASNKSNNVRIEFDGEIKTLAQWSQKMGISSPTIVSRIQAGWSVEQAFGLEMPPTGRISAPVEITYRRQTKTLKEWSKKVNIPRHKLFDRYERGWEPGEILGYKKRKRERGTRGKPIGLTYKGKTQSVYDWAKQRNMDPQVILNRVAKKWEIAAVLGYKKADTRTERAKEEGRKMKLRKANKCATHGCPNAKKRKKKGPGAIPKYCRKCRP